MFANTPIPSQFLPAVYLLSSGIVVVFGYGQADRSLLGIVSASVGIAVVVTVLGVATAGAMARSRSSDKD